LNLTKTKVLEYHFWYDDNTRRNGDRKVVKIDGSGWSTSDLFMSYFVINEAKYVEAPKYTEIDVKNLTLQELDEACFAFNGINQVNSHYISKHRCHDTIIFISVNSFLSNQTRIQQSYYADNLLYCVYIELICVACCICHNRRIEISPRKEHVFATQLL
jgi:hypothetical protein